MTWLVQTTLEMSGDVWRHKRPKQTWNRIPAKPKKIRFLKHGSCRMWLTTAHWHFENIENSALVALVTMQVIESGRRLHMHHMRLRLAATGTTAVEPMVGFQTISERNGSSWPHSLVWGLA